MAVVCIPSVVAVLGCSDDAGGNPQRPTGEALYAVSIRIPGTPIEAAAVLLEGLDADVVPDLPTALDVPNAGSAVGTNGEGRIYVADGATPQLTEFELGENGSLKQGRTLSLQAFVASASGVAAGNFVFSSPTKAFVIDTLGRTIVTWNPATMEITNTVDIGQIAVSGQIPVIAGRPVARDGEVVVALAYIELPSAFAPDSKLMFIDPASETVTQLVTVSDCAGVSDILVDENGDLYIASDVAAVFNRLSGLSSGTECVGRVPAGSYAVEDRTPFGQFTEGADGGSLMQQQGTHAYTRILDESLLPSDPGDISDYNGTAAWRWGRLDTSGKEPFELIGDLPPQSGSSRSFMIDGAIWATESTPMLERTALYDMSTESLQPGVSVPGIVMNAFRVR